MKVYIANNNHGIILGVYAKREDAVERLRKEYEEIKDAYGTMDPEVQVDWNEKGYFQFFDYAEYDDYFYTVEEHEIQ